MKNKLLISCVIIVLGILAFGTISASADTEGIFTYSVSEGEATITDCSASASGDIIIPATLGGYAVTKIDDDAFSFSIIASIVIPDSVTSIGNFAFDCCENLTAITLGNGVISIGDYAFSSCTSLTSITIPDSVTSIGNYTFTDCESLEKIIVSGNNKHYSNDEFGVLFNKDKTTLISLPAANKLTSYIIPDEVTSIADTAFVGCNSLEKIIVSGKSDNYSNDEFGVLFNKDKTTLIRFPVASKLTSYLIPDSVTNISNCAFSNCINLKNILIPDNVTNIGFSAFYSCNSLSSIELPSGVTSIGDAAFSSCSSLTSIELPDSVTSIGGFAFYNCLDLASVTIGSGVTSIGVFAFGDCTSLKTVYYNGIQAMWDKISIGSNNTPLSLAEIIFTPGNTMEFDGAQIRTESPQGLRFVFSIPKAMYDMLEHPKSPSDTGLGFGNVVMPKKYLGDNELTKETEVTLNGKVYKSKIAPAVNLFEITDDEVKFTVCVIEIPEKNYSEEYVAIPYMTYIENGEEITVYGEKSHGITVFSIAEMAYADSKTSDSNKEYLYNNILNVVDPEKYPTNK